MANKIKGLLVDVTRAREIKEVEFEDSLENIYSLLDVDCIDVAVRKVGNHAYDFIVDDEGLLKGNAIPSVFDGEQKPQLVGNALIVNSNEEGDFTSLTEEQIVDLKNHVGSIIVDDGIIPVIVGADYE